MISRPLAALLALVSLVAFVSSCARPYVVVYGDGSRRRARHPNAVVVANPPPPVYVAPTPVMVAPQPGYVSVNAGWTQPVAATAAPPAQPQSAASDRVCYSHSRFDGSGYRYACDAYVKLCRLGPDGRPACDGAGGYDGGTGCIQGRDAMDALGIADATLARLVAEGQCSCIAGDNRIHMNPQNHRLNTATCRFLPALD